MARILVVDDELEVCNALQMFLSFKGYDIEIASNGREALECLRREKIDLVLLDVVMPAMNGFETCRAIKNDESLNGIAVIMVTALAEKRDRIEGIEAGADDFINKPIDQSEVLARIRMLLKLKQANDLLSQTYDTMRGLIVYGEKSFNGFVSVEFDFQTKVDGIVEQIIRTRSDVPDKPESVVVGHCGKGGEWTWHHYESVFRRLNRTIMKSNIRQSLDSLWTEETQIGFLNEEEMGRPEFGIFARALQVHNVQPRNMVYYFSDGLCIFNVNYGREVGRYDADILHSMVTISDFLRNLALQVRETEEAFGYTIHALARASEVNDEDTGKHVLRIGEYAGLVAGRLGLAGNAVQTIRQQAQLHDVGKIYIPPAILKKPGKLTEEEMKAVKMHPLYGAKIIGGHPRLKVGQIIALTHHERWDGTGYPRGLEGEQIPIEGRIAALGDQYDALRNRRVYKDALDHATVCDIFLRGDQRTMPGHFDPEIMKVFLSLEKEFAAIYERLKD